MDLLCVLSCALLQLSGIKSAPLSKRQCPKHQIFSIKVLKKMKAAGFEQSKYNASLYHKGMEHAYSGGAHGATVQGDKRKREIDDVGERGKDICMISEVDAALGGGTHGDAVEGGGDAGIPEDEVLISEPLVRRTPITQHEIDKYGMTPGCEGCEAKSRGEVTRRGHSERCRNRIEEAMRNYDADKKKIENSRKNDAQHC